MNGRTAQPDPLPWGALVQAARLDPNAIEPILDALTPPLRAVAWRLSRRYADDALQASRIGVWKALPDIDCRRTAASIRRCLMVIGINAMRDEIRRRVRQNNRAVDNSEAILDLLPAAPIADNSAEPTLAGALEHARDRGLINSLSSTG